MVFNKADRFSDKALLQTLCRRFDAVAISAPDKATLFELLHKIESFLADISIAHILPNR
jgi:GTPase